MSQMRTSVPISISAPSPWQLQFLLGCPHPDQIGKSPSCCCESVAGTQPLCRSGLRPSDSKSEEGRWSVPLSSACVPILLQPSDSARLDLERSRLYPQSLVLETRLVSLWLVIHCYFAFLADLPHPLKVPSWPCRSFSIFFLTLVTLSRDRGLRRKFFPGGLLICPIPSPMSLRPDAASEA